MMNWQGTKYSLRVGFAMGLIAFVTHFLGLEKIFWIILTAMVTMLPTVGATLDRSKQRAISTVMGVLIGGILAYLFQGQLWFVVAAGVVFIFLACYEISTHYVRAVFYISVVLVVFLGYIEHDIWMFAFWRFVDTIIGVAVGFACSLLLFPSWSKKNIHGTLYGVITDLRDLSRLVVAPGLSPEQRKDLERVRLSAIKNTDILKQEYSEMRHEMPASNKQLMIMDAIVLTMERLRLDLYLVDDMQASSVVSEKLKQLAEYTDEVFTTLLSCCQAKKPLMEVKMHDYHIVESPYATQAVRSYITDLVALQQNVTYLYS